MDRLLSTRNQIVAQWCSEWIVRWPRTALFITLGVHVSFVIITAVLFVMGYDILPVVFDDLPIQTNDEPMFLRNEAWKHRDDDLKINANSSSHRTQRSPHGTDNQLNAADDLVYRDRKDLEFNNKFTEDSLLEMPDSCLEGYCTSAYTGPVKSRRKRHVLKEGYVHQREFLLGTLTLIYEVPVNTNIFTKHNLQNMARLEYAMYNMPEFQQRYCKLTLIAGALNCQQFFSILRFFDGSFSKYNKELYDPSFTNITNVIYHAFTTEQTKDHIKSFFGIKSVYDLKSRTFSSAIARSTMSFGYPLESFDKRTDNQLEQRAPWRKWLKSHMKPLLEQYEKDGIGQMKFAYFSKGLYFQEALNQILVDWTLIFGALVFIFCFMWFQTGSLWITGFGTFSILTSFLGANLVYRVLLGYRYFGYFNVMALFVLLGIGADDIFIFTDTWKQHLGHRHPTLQVHLAIVFRRSTMTMFVTSLTTMTAFFVNCFSSLLPIASFGAFAGVAVLINYLSVITFLPCVVMVHHLHFATKKERKPVLEVTLNTPSAEVSVHDFNGKCAAQEPILQIHAVHGSCDSIIALKRSYAIRFNSRLSHFFTGAFYNFVTHSVIRVIILGSFVSVVTISAYLCTTIQLDNDMFRVFDASHKAEISKNKLRFGFLSNADDAKVQIHIVWGLAPQDRTMCPTKEYNGLYPCNGRTVYDPSFDLNDPEAQLKFYEFCWNLKYGNEGKVHNLHLYSKIDNPDGYNVDCFMLDMVKFYKEEASLSYYPVGTKFDLPFTKEKATTLMKYNDWIFRDGAVENIKYPFEFFLDWWLTHRYTNDTIPDTRSKYSKLVGLRTISSVNLAHSNGKKLILPGVDDDWLYPEIYNKKLLFASVKVTTSMSTWSLGLVEGLGLLDTWEKYMTNQTTLFPPSLAGGWQVSESYVWLRVIHNLSGQGVVAVAIGLGLSFVVILIGTTNVITAVWATLLLASVTVCVVAIIPLAGWKFGLLEALNVCLIVGLAVDYIVHLAEGYHMSNRTNRLHRIQDALMTVGMSIIGGATTTLGASLFMMFPKLLFFKQFGTFVFCTILLSLVFSLLVFVAGFSIFGPEGNTGSFMAWKQNSSAGATRRFHTPTPSPNEAITEMVSLKSISDSTSDSKTDREDF